MRQLRTLCLRGVKDGLNHAGHVGGACGNVLPFSCRPEGAQWVNDVDQHDLAKVGGQLGHEYRAEITGTEDNRRAPLRAAIACHSDYRARSFQMWFPCRAAALEPRL